MRFRNLALAFVVGSILVVGGLPGKPHARNAVRWNADGGLRFSESSQAVSEDSLWLHGDEFTVEVWLSPDPPAGPGNREILSFDDGPGVRPLLLGQFQEGFFLRGRAQNPAGRPKLDRYQDHPVGATDHLAVVGRGQKALLFVQGSPTRVSVKPPELPFGGRLVLGSTNTGWRPWGGVIRAVAVYDRSVGPEELRRHATSRPIDVLSASGEQGLVAFYLFDEPAGMRIESAIAGAPALRLPERVRRPSRKILRFAFLPEAQWFRRDVARNTLAFMPLGLLVAWRRGRSGALLAVFAGLLLSLVIEVGQVFIPGRVSSATDLIFNTLGSGLGAALGFALASALSARARSGEDRGHRLQ